jgi:hypothetical protein
MSEAVRTWIVKLDDNPAGLDGRGSVPLIRSILDFGESSETPDNLGDFVFPPMVEKQHAIVFGYLGQEQTVWSLKKCEYYFPRSWRPRARSRALIGELVEMVADDADPGVDIRLRFVRVTLPLQTTSGERLLRYDSRCLRLIAVAIA